VAVREQEPVASFPLGIVGPVGERAAVRDRQDVGHAERLPDVALALDLAHAQGIASDAIGAVAELRADFAVENGFHGSTCRQWMSMPPLMSSVMPVR
jgi:hypothetical protein